MRGKNTSQKYIINDYFMNWLRAKLILSFDIILCQFYNIDSNDPEDFFT